MLLEDRALTDKVATSSKTTYLLRILDDTGHDIVPTTRRAPTKNQLSIVLPRAATHDYVVVHIQAQRESVAAPRAFEAHLARDSGRFRLIGVRH